MLTLPPLLLIISVPATLWDSSATLSSLLMLFLVYPPTYATVAAFKTVAATLYHCFRVLLFVFLSQPTLIIIKTRSRQEKTTWEKPPPILVHTHWTQCYHTRKQHRRASPNEPIVFSQARKGCARVFAHSIAVFHTHKGPGLRQSQSSYGLCTTLSHLAENGYRSSPKACYNEGPWKLS